MATSPRIAIIGGGPGGLMLARLLQVRGAAATVFERDPHADHRPQGGSLDLHLETGQRALGLAGLEAAFLAHARPEDQGDRLYDPSGALLFNDDGDDFGRPEIDRTALRAILLDSLDEKTVAWARRSPRCGPVQTAPTRWSRRTARRSTTSWSAPTEPGRGCGRCCRTPRRSMRGWCLSSSASRSRPTGSSTP
ncbi:MAG: FAD-dependent monooxygenase [Caulobacteraceae bacterium]